MGGSLDPDTYFDLFLDDLRPSDDDLRPSDDDLRPSDDDLPHLLAATAWQRWWQQAAAMDPDAASSGFVLTGAELAARGHTRSQRRTAVRRGRWQEAGRGLISPVDPMRGGGDAFVIARRRHALLAAGASRRRPGEVIAARSGAVLHGLPTLRVPAEPELLLARQQGSGRLGSGHLYAAACPQQDVTAWFGRPVTTVARTLVDLGRHDRFDAIMAADAALREHLTSSREIARALDGAVGWPGVRQARAVLALADPLAESPLESVTRLRLHDAGLPTPTLQRWIARCRVDFYWPQYRFVLEADGRLKYAGAGRADAGWDEKKREQALRRSPDVDRVERVVWDDVLRDWPETLRILESILR